MGIKLGRIITGETINSQDLKSSRVAVDALNTIMIFLKRKYTPKRNSNFSMELAVDKTQRAISHLYGVFYRTIRLLENEILPIFCFDGKVDDMKRFSTKDEISDFRKTKERYENALKRGDKLLARHIALGKEFLWKNAINETRELLTHMGIPYINSPTEGEAQCAQLVKMGICDFVASADFDTLLFGSKSLLNIRGFKGKKMEANMYNLNTVLEQLNINRFQLIDLSILIGNDYFPGIKSIGIKTGIKLLKKYGSLDGILCQDPNQEPLSILIKKNISKERINRIRKLFIKPDVLTRIPKISIHFPKRGGIKTLMCVDHNLNIDRIEKGINRLIRAYKKIIKIQNTTYLSQIKVKT